MSNVLCCPCRREVLLIGGENVKTQVQMLNEGVRENEDFLFLHTLSLVKETQTKILYATFFKRREVHLQNVGRSWAIKMSKNSHYFYVLTHFSLLFVSLI